MNRRDFSALALGSSLAASAFAQGGPIEGRHYKLPAKPVGVPTAKIDVVEFFWYGCPHCYVFDPALNEWVKKLPADVAFRRVHMLLRPAFRPHHKLFFTLESLGLEAQLHGAVFEAFHEAIAQRNGAGVESDADMADLAVKLGVDRAKFTQMYASFGVQQKCTQADQLAEAFGIDGVPALGIAGRFWTAPSLNHSMPPLPRNEQELGLRALTTTDFLIQRVRSSK
ncbi:MAG TPA: thiol:disulfide interchange protein DsbA/DsbL [Burkholderiaceae bacterium]